jgi:hypothetical protein
MKTKVKPMESNVEPQKINVWLVRSPEVPKQKFNDVFNLLRSIKVASGLAFHFKTKETELVDEEEEGSVEIELIHKTWAAFFEQAEDFRAGFQEVKKEEDKVKVEDYVVILSDHGNKELWFSGADYGGKNNIFVHCEEWNFFAKGSDVRYPIAYHVVITLLHHKWGIGLPELLKKIHGLNPEDPHLGCINDFCADKDQVHFKIRTGDICEKCIEEFLQAGVNKFLILQVLEIIGKISGFMKFSNKWRLDEHLPTLSIKKDKRIFSFDDFGNLKLNPQLLSVQVRVFYELVYNYQKQGTPIGLNAFLFTPEIKAQFKAAYLKAKGNDVQFEGDQETYAKTKKLEESIEDLCDPANEQITRQTTLIRTAFVNALGSELAENYIVHNVFKKGFTKKVYIIGKNANDTLLSHIQVSK